MFQDFCLLHDDGRDGCRTVRRRRRRLERAKSGSHLLTGYGSNLTPFKEGQNLPSKVDPVYPEGSRFPSTTVPNEDFGGDRLEQGFARSVRLRTLAVAEIREHRPGPGARFRFGHGACIAHDLPEPPTLVLAMDEESLRARRHHPHAVSLQFGIPDITNSAAVPEGIDSALREANPWQDCASSTCCIGVRNWVEFRTRLHQKMDENIL